MKARVVWAFLVFCVIHFTQVQSEEDDENFDPYTTMDPAKREPHPCEICKYFATELRDRLAASAKSKEVIETGHGLEKKKRFAYLKSELRLTEALHEPHICENILQYNVHAERKGSLRYAKGMSETFQTLHGLVDKGVKVELGIPYELWDKPSAEVTKMHRWCFNLAEEYEDDIEDWYYNRQEEDLLTYLCRDRYLKDKNSDPKCLDEEFTSKEDNDKEKDTSSTKKSKTKKKKKKALKGDTSSSSEVPPGRTEL